MGLDISAFRKLHKLEATFDRTTGQLVDNATGAQVTTPWTRAWENPDFEGRLAGLEAETFYGHAGDSMHFRAGSYSGHGDFRRKLAVLAGYEGGFDGALVLDGGPFWELLCFSDCEGCLGPLVSAKLAKDFADFQDTVDSKSGEYFRQLYASWRKAFEMAADGGMVVFH